MPRNVLRLLVRIAVLAAPLLAIVALYIAFDPFMAIHVSSWRRPDDSRVAYNRDVYSTQAFMGQDPQQHYNAFILGSSRSFAFLCDDWKQTAQVERPFHFDASSETLFGVWSKVKWLEWRGADPRDALVILDASMLRAVTDSESFMLVKHPALSGRSAVSFQLIFFNQFVSHGYALGYAYYRLTNRVPGYLKDAFLSQQFTLLPSSNDVLFTSQDQEIRDRGAEYWTSRPLVFREREPGTLAPSIGPTQLDMLREMAAIFAAHHTRVHLVISPLYDQKTIAPADVAQLKSLFGAGNVHDFSGVNEFTRDVQNYYEESHYRPRVGRAIMKQIYQPGEPGR